MATEQPARLGTAGQHHDRCVVAAQRSARSSVGQAVHHALRQQRTVRGRQPRRSYDRLSDIAYQRPAQSSLAVAAVETLASRREQLTERFYTPTVLREPSCLHYLLPDNATQPALTERLRHAKTSKSLLTKTEKNRKSFFTARCYASAVLAMGICLCLSVSVCLCLSQVEVLLKRLNVGSHKQHHTIAQGL